MIRPETLLQDLRYGTRMLSRNAGFTVVAVIALALGIGVNTAVFTAYKAMVARPLDARAPGEMVNIALLRRSGASDFTFSYPDYEALRDSVRSFSGLIAYSPDRMALTEAGSVLSERAATSGTVFARLGLFSSGGSNKEFASTYVVSENYFQVLGVRALRGRTFESIPIAQLLDAPAVLISENYWQRRFGGDPAILGKTVRLNSVAMAIVGIAPHDFVGTGVASPDFWMPIRLAPLVHPETRLLRDRENQFCRLFGRLAPAAGAARAQAEMTSLVDHLRTLHDPRSEAAKPSTVLVWRGSPFPLPLYLYTGLILTIALVMVAAGMVLAVACANVGSLQLARARSRQNELHTRASLGAGRLRIIRQLLTESALLALLAGAVAFLLSWALLRIAVSLAAGALPVEIGTLVFHVSPDLAIFGYVFAVSLMAGVLFGLAPALESSRSAISSTHRGSTSPARSRRIQDFLIAAQVGLSLVLMLTGSMLIRSSIRALTAETGYDSKHVVDLDLQFSESPRYTASRKLALVRDLRNRLSALPAVAEITSARPPVDSRFRTLAVSVNTARTSQSILYYTYVEPNYFETLRVRLSLGHGFQPGAEQPEHSVILSESAAAQLWPGENPIGRSIRLGPIDELANNRGLLAAQGPAWQVIGIARDTRGVQFDGSDTRKVYLQLSPDQIAGRSLLIRTRSDPGQIMRVIDPVVASLDPDLSATSSTLEELLRQTGPLIVSSLAAGVASSVGLLGLVLASMGIYGTVSYIVVLRTREIGIRMAVGARKADILALILREVARPVTAGLLVGMLGATGASYVLRRLLFGLNSADAIVFMAVSLLFLAIALFAAYPPSRRALRVDPMVALRYE